MDNKIKYVDLNGLKMFAESLKQDLKNHVIELGLYQELLHRIENLELYKIVDLLPEKGDEDTIYLLKNPSGSGDKNVFIEYLYNNEHGWEEIGNFTPTLELDEYLKIEDASFEKGYSENSAVLKGGDNIAGLKGFYVNAINGDSIYISEVNTEISENIPSIDEQFDNPYAVGDEYSLQLGEIYYNLGVITSINHNLMVVSNLKPIKYDDRLRYYFYVTSKPSLGVVDLGLYTSALGFENSANDFCAHSEGWKNKSIGKYSHTEGKENEAYYCAHAEGSNNVAKGNTSHVEGTDNIASNSNAHSEGRYTTASGYASHAEGYGENINNRTVASGEGSHAEGRFTTASGKWSHAEGEKTESSGLAAHAEGLQTLAEGQASHAEGRYTYAKGVQSHAEGYGKPDGSTGAFGAYSHSEGQYTTASGAKSHSEGTETIASTDSSHTEGLRTVVSNPYEHAQGKCNQTNSGTIHSVGIGESKSKPKNAHEIFVTGEHFIINIGDYKGTNPKPGVNDLASIIKNLDTKIDTEISNLIDSAPETLDTLKEIADYIESDQTNAGKVASQLANHTNRINDLETDNVIVKGEAEHSAVLKGEITVLGVTYKNEALNEGCVSLGANSKAGLKGYYFTYIDFNTNQIWLHNKQFTSRTLGSLGGWKKNSVSDVNRCGWAQGDVISFTCDGHYDNSATIVNVVDNVITVDKLPFTLDDVPSSIISIEAANNKFDECSVFCVKKFNIGTVELGGNAFAIGTNTQASNAVAYAEGYNTVAYGKYSHTEGNETEAGYNAHAEGYKTKASGHRSHAEGQETQSIGNKSHAEGGETAARGNFSHAEGYKTTANGGASHAEGSSTEAGENAHSEGLRTKARGENSHAEGQETQAIGTASHAEGGYTVASGWYSHAEGYSTSAKVTSAHAEGHETIASGKASHVEGAGLIYNNVQYGVALGKNSHAEGQSRAEGKSSHSEGDATIARGKYSHSEGCETLAAEESSHAEGYLTQAEGYQAHAEGKKTKAIGDNTHTEGLGTIAYNSNEHASGKYNQSTKSDDKSQATHFSIGIGTSDTDRKNAFEVKQDGKHYILGVGDYDGTTTEGATDVATVINNLKTSGGGSSATPDWNAQEGEAGYIENKPFEEKIVYNFGRIYYAGGEYIDGDYHIKLGNITPRYDEYSGYTFPNFHLTGYLGHFDEETGNDQFVNIISLAGQYPIYKYDSIPYDEDIPYTIYLQETTEFDNYDVYLKTRLGEIKYDLVCNIVEISTLNELFIPDTIARKSDINNITTKNITTDFGITIENLLGDYEDYYTFWSYVTQGYNTINYNNDENTIAFPISMRENSEILGNNIYIPYPDGQIEIYYADGSGLGGKIIKTFVDPIVHKYLLNPCIIRHSEEIPQELLDEDLKLKYPYPSMYRSYYNGNYNICIQSNNDNSIDDTFGNNWFSESGIWSNGKEL